MFGIDERILTTCVVLDEWHLSTILLKNETNYPWFILIPRRANIQELFQLELADRSILMEEIHRASILMKEFFKPYKLNIGSLGNIVEQLHIHIVGRSQDDLLWPQGIWQSSFVSQPYQEEKLNETIISLKLIISQFGLA